MESKFTMFGVSGRLVYALWPSSEKYPDGLHMHQTFKSDPRAVDAKEWGKGREIRVEVRLSDNPRNGHDTFAITAHIYRPGARDWDACGCLHDEIVKYFPELAHLVKWHGVATDGPLHYIGNTCYLAGDADSCGRRSGEPSRWETFIRFDDVPALHRVSGKFFEFIRSRMVERSFKVVSIAHDHKSERDRDLYSPKFTICGYGEKWHECPFDSKAEADAFCDSLNECEISLVKSPTRFSEGKKRELDAARKTAIWPDATDAELSVDRSELEKALRDRLPALMADFRADMLACGFVYTGDEQ